MQDKIRVVEFDASYQIEAANLINVALGERFGHIDETMNPDLFDIESNFLAGEFLVALAGEQVVGTGALMPLSADQGQIMRMHTASQYRRSGIATRVLKALEDSAIVRGFCSLVLETNLDWSDAISFYQKNGFTEYARNAVEVHFRKEL